MIKFINPKEFSQAPLAQDLGNFLADRLKFSSPVSIEFSNEPQGDLGNTAYYSPGEKKIRIYTNGRHPKDCLRSMSHEMIHHNQFCNNKFGAMQSNKITEDSNVKKLEEDAYLNGNILFREWEEKYKKGKENEMSRKEKIQEVLTNSSLFKKYGKKALMEAFEKIAKGKIEDEEEVLTEADDLEEEEVLAEGCADTLEEGSEEDEEDDEEDTYGSLQEFHSAKRMKKNEKLMEALKNV